MCGIVGVITTEGAKDAGERSKFFRNALIADAIRGPHSTGFFKVTEGTQYNQPKVEIHKRAFHANDFLDLRPVDMAINNLSSTNILIGHNRWATVGGIHHETAHPFSHDGVTMVHNGTLDYYYDLEGYNKFDVDSEILTYAMSKTDDPKTVLEKLDGAYALIWYDERDHKLRTARNNERPLHYAYEKKANTLLVASEAGMLSWLADRHDFDIEKVWSLAPGKLVTFDLDDLRKYDVEDFKILPPWGYYKSAKNAKSTNVVSYIKPDKLLNDLGLSIGGSIVFDPDEFKPYQGVAHDPRIPRWGRLLGTVNTPSGIQADVEINGLKEADVAEMVGYSIVAEVVSVNKNTYENTGTYKIVAKDPLYMEEVEDVESETDGDEIPFDTEDSDYERYGPYNTYISNKRWLELIANGCGMCHGNIEEDDDDETGWDSAGKPICKHCLAQNGWDQLQGI